MKLSFEQIRSVTVGAVRVERQPDGIHFHKCTQKQVDAWRALSATLGERALTTTGIRLDFHTNSKTLRFFPTSGEKFEVYLDGVLRQAFDGGALREAGSSAELSLTDALGGEVDSIRVTLILPSHSVGVLESVELEDGATLTPHAFDCKLLFIGDSITQGWEARYDSLSYAYRVSRFFNADSVIHGVGGGYFHETIFDSIPFDPDTVVISLGTNDFGHYKTQEEMRYQTAAFLSLIAMEYAGKKIFVISPIWRKNQQKTMGSFREARAIVIEEAERLGLCHIDGLSLVPPMSQFFPDGTLHPDDLGFSLYAENLIEQMLKKM
ncbi:MAG: SGNH/GDSL hydrolase family protein [Clostridia bacterium]|nr:SGNH/GDSL hydrolase family protein [Clostridia bacterium]